METPRLSGYAGFDRLFTSPHYERLRSRLIRIFARRGCAIPEDLADETLARVTTRLSDVRRSYEGDPAHFVYAVARNVYLEYSRRPRTVSLETEPRLPNEGDTENVDCEPSYVCLENCIDQLDPEDKFLILEYYLHDKGEKIARRRTLAAELELGMNALRIKACRIRQKLRACVRRCLTKKGQDLGRHD